jgi:hypothetical protein
MPLDSGNNIGAASGAHIFTQSATTFQPIVAPRPSSPCVSAQIQGMGVPASDFMLHPHP